MDLLIIAEIFFTVFLLNANPIFTIPTWIVVAFFAGKTDPVLLIPIIVIAIFASAIGRYVLASYSKNIGDKVLPKRQKRNIEYLKEFFIEIENPKIAFIIAFLYALSPLPTNALFVVAGIAHLRILTLIGGFFFGELLSNIVYITVLETALEQVTFSTYEYLLMGIIGVGIAVAIFIIDWKKTIKSLVQRELEKKSHSAIREMFK
ncbi:MAG: hypothetical protein QXE90_03835 [Candidatus Micrarchaeia archaeon]